MKIPKKLYPIIISILPGYFRVNKCWKIVSDPRATYEQYILKNEFILLNYDSIYYVLNSYWLIEKIF